MQRMTNRREGHLHHGRGGNITLKLAAASFISLYAPPSAAEIQINDKSASAFQPSSPYFIPLSQYSIPLPSSQHWKSTGRITSPSSSPISLLFERSNFHQRIPSHPWKGNDHEKIRRNRNCVLLFFRGNDTMNIFPFFFSLQFQIYRLDLS